MPVIIEAVILRDTVRATLLNDRWVTGNAYFQEILDEISKFISVGLTSGNPDIEFAEKVIGMIGGKIIDEGPLLREGPIFEKQDIKDIGLPSILKHLPDKHDQQSHGRGDGRRVGSGSNLHIDDENSPIVKQHLKDLGGLNPSILKSLKSKGVQFYIGNKPMTELDHNEMWKGVRPRGWSEGQTWDKVAGCYKRDTGEVILGAGLSGAVSLAGHETGHAILDKIIKEDAGKMKMLEDIHSKYWNVLDSYLTQGPPRNSVGVHEMFAEAVSNLTRGEGFYNMVNTKADVKTLRSFREEMTSLIKDWGIV